MRYQLASRVLPSVRALRVLRTAVRCRSSPRASTVVGARGGFGGFSGSPTGGRARPFRSAAPHPRQRGRSSAMVAFVVEKHESAATAGGNSRRQRLTRCLLLRTYPLYRADRTKSTNKTPRFFPHHRSTARAGTDCPALGINIAREGLHPPSVSPGTNAWQDRHSTLYSQDAAPPPSPAQWRRQLPMAR